jgi:hypothetical protein
MMMTTEDPHFEVEINYTKAVISRIIFQSLRWYYIATLIILLLGAIALLFGATFNAGIILSIVMPMIITKSNYDGHHRYFERFGLGKTLTLTLDLFSWQWKNKVTISAPWQTFYRLQKSEKLWLLYVDKKLALFLPTDQLPPEAQAFILQKLTEYNVPIKG